MNKEELEKEAVIECFMLTVNTICIDQRDVELAYVMGAEPREKQIEIDTEHIRALQKQNGELTDKVKELEAQIEQIKCCYNCKHSRTEYEHCKTDKHEKWEMKEK